MAQPSSQRPRKKKKKKKHFKQQKNHGNSKRMELHEYATATLGAGNMREAVRLPKGEDFNEWMAVNTVDFFNEISLLYGIITEYCTKAGCPVMSAGPKYEYLWMDGVKYKKPHKCSAPEYIDLLMTWVEDQINDPRIFPIEDGVPFPSNFRQIIKTILKRLFRVYGHMYHHHIQKIVQLDAEAHLNTCFKHFIYFVKEFKLVDQRELAPLADTINHMLTKDAQKGHTYKPKYKYGNNSSNAARAINTDVMDANANNNNSNHNNSSNNNSNNNNNNDNDAANANSNTNDNEPAENNGNEE